MCLSSCSLFAEKDATIDNSMQEQKTGFEDEKQLEISSTEDSSSVQVKSESSEYVNIKESTSKDTSIAETKVSSEDSNVNLSSNMTDEKTSETSKTNTSKSSKSSDFSEASSSDFDYSNIRAGFQINIKTKFPVYETANDAYLRQNKALDYEAGVYYVYKVTNQAVNLSRRENESGAWVNLASINQEQITIINRKSSETSTSNEQSNSSEQSTTVLAKLSTKAYAWSYGSPDSSGKAILESNYGLYRKYNDENKIYLTFDNGYEYENLTASILDTLSRKGVKVVFFLTGDYLVRNYDLVKRMIADGHIIGNHSQKHKNHAKVSNAEVREDLLAWEKTYQSLYGALPQFKLYRPPAGEFSEQSLSIAKDLGYKTVLWSFAYADWDTSNQMSSASALSRLNDNLFGGTIILLHSVSRTNANILEQFINDARAKSYEFALLS